MTPYKCPACDGFGKRVRKEGGKKKRCKACHGTCVVWSQTYNYAYPQWTYTSGLVADVATDTVVDTGVYGTAGQTWAAQDVTITAS
jgi:DnaJ-class molecular chaperone